MKIAFVIHEAVVAELVEAFPGEPIIPEPDDFEYAPWAKKPNSTLRLTLTNLEAMRRLQSEGFDITVMSDCVWSRDVAKKYEKFDLVVLNTVASQSSIDFTRGVLRWLESGPRRPKVIFGTETTWQAALNRKKISRGEFEAIYNNHFLLRHTARTEKGLAKDGKLTQACIQEFEIGFDESLFPPIRDFQFRNLILFVRAPEGRSTKNNGAIEKFVELVKQTPSLGKYEVVVLCPPYSLAEYWDLLSRTAFLVFTSNGETFSYVLNDAKAMGVITLFPEHLYRAEISRRVWVDSYPQLGIRYSSVNGALQAMVNIAESETRAARESSYSQTSVVSSFGIEQITSNWRKLLSREMLNTNILLVYGATLSSKEQVEKIALEYGASIAFSFQNRGYVSTCSGDADPETRCGLVYLRDNFSGSDSSATDRGVAAAQRSGPMRDEELTTYMQLLVRIHKIGVAVLPASLKGSSISRALQAVRVAVNWETGTKELEIRWAEF